MAQTAPTAPLFRDVPRTHWAFAAVQRLAAAGILQGYPVNEAPATRAVAKITPARGKRVAVKAKPTMTAR